jgi:hypothetical protein
VGGAAAAADRPRPCRRAGREQYVIHVIGGRVDSFHTNSNLHHTYDTQKDTWTAARNPLPTARSGHGAVLYRGKIFIMGGEGTNRVYGQNEAYDPGGRQVGAYAPMLTPRHGLGAALVGDAIMSPAAAR